MSELEMMDVPSEETLKRFPGMVALQVVYENFAYGCTRCELYARRLLPSIVFGYGNTEEPPIAFVGDAPSSEEVEAGFPFEGTEAGELLTKVIEAMGMTREEVYVLNAIGCLTRGGRIPTKNELSSCLPILSAQLKAIRPKVIVAMGATACRQLLQTADGVEESRRKWHEWEGIPLRVTYHPAYLLVRPQTKTRVWTDMKVVLAKLGREVPE